MESKGRGEGEYVQRHSGGDRGSGRHRDKSPRSKSRSRSRDRRGEGRQGSRRDYGRGRYDDDDHRSSYRGGYKKFREVELPGLDGPLLSMREFMERQKETLQFDKAEEIYSNYKKKWESKQNDIFFTEHKNDEWFKEKYEPLLSAKLNEERRAQAKQNADRFFKGLEEGQFDSISLEVNDSQVDKVGSDQQGGDTMVDEEEANKAKKNQPFQEVYLKEGIDITKSPFFGFDPNSMTLFIRSIRKDISRWELEQALQKVPGFVSLSLSEPLKTQDFIRFGWILFDSEDKCNKAQTLLANLTINAYLFTIVKSKAQRRPIKVVPNVSKDKMEEDVTLSRELIQTLDKEKGIVDNILLSRAAQLPLTKVLDLQTLYLRRVHSYAFYEGSEYHDERLLSAKCGPIHVRMTIKGEEEREAFDLPDWRRRVVELIRKRVDDSKTGAIEQYQSVQQATDEINQAFDEYMTRDLKDEGGKFGCPYCEKFFAGPTFVIKHIRNKHEEDKDIVETKRKVVEKLTRKNYAKDKNRITNTPTFQPYRRVSGPPRRGGGRPTSEGPRADYKDLDDPKQRTPGSNLPVKTGRPVIDYADL